MLTLNGQSSNCDGTGDCTFRTSLFLFLLEIFIAHNNYRWSSYGQSVRSRVIAISLSDCTNDYYIVSCWPSLLLLYGQATIDGRRRCKRFLHLLQLAPHGKVILSTRHSSPIHYFVIDVVLWTSSNIQWLVQNADIDAQYNYISVIYDLVICLDHQPSKNWQTA